MLIGGSIPELQSRLARGALTCDALARHAIEARRASAGLNAFRHTNDDALLAQARHAQTLINAGQQRELTGLPFSLKDMFAVSGYDCFAGMAQPIPKEWERRTDWTDEGPVVNAIRQSGGVIAGITHAAELAVGGVGVNAHWGAPRNPWDGTEHRVAGGSSSGAAISVISGACAYALGTDTGGSVRVPASAAGVVGLKTSAGLWPVEGVVPLASRFDTIGIFAMTVEDTMAVFTGINLGSASSHSVGGRQDTVTDGASVSSTLSSVSLASIRCRRASACAWDGLDDGIQSAVDTALNDCGAVGLVCEDHDEGLFEQAAQVRDDGPNTAAYEAYRLVASAPGLLDTLSPYVRDFIASGKDVTAETYQQRVKALMVWRQQVSQWVSVHDIIVCPTLRWTPPTIAALASPEAYARYSDGLLHNTVLPSVSGLCAITLPVGLDAAGMPVGLQLCARAGNERALLQVALTIERTIGTGWQRCGSPPLLNRAL